MITSRDSIKYFSCLYISLSIVLLFITISEVLRPFYIDKLNQNIELKIVATGEANVSSLSNNVRISNITVNGKDINLGNIYLNECAGWEYESRNDFIYVYNLISPDELQIDLEDVHSLEVSMIQDVGSGYVELYINDKIWKQLDLYADATWEKISVKYNTSIWVSPAENIFFLVGLFLVTYVILIMIPIKKNIWRKWKVSAIKYIIFFVCAFLTIILVELVQYQSFSRLSDYFFKQRQPLIKSVIVLCLGMLILYMVCGKIWISFGIISFLTTVASIVSRIKIYNRDVPLLPWDCVLFGEALSVMCEYEISLSYIDIFALIFILGITVVLSCKKEVRCQNFHMRMGKCSIVVLIFFLYIHTGIITADIEANDVEYRVYQVKNYYDERGFLMAFLECMSYLNVSKEPDGYSEEKIQEICNDLMCIAIDKENGYDTPSIIAIMSESFWNISKLDTIKLSEDLLPEYEKLKETSHYGNLYTHVFNGGTVTSEFEFLTGFSGVYFPKDYMVYGKFLGNDFFSVVSQLKEQGYKTTAMHPYTASNYNREYAYQQLGFEQCFFEEDFNNVEYVRGYVSDASLYEKIIEEYEKQKGFGQPQFIFSVTMQNHGGYWANSIYEKEAMNFTTSAYGNVAKGCISDYLAGIHESDRALGELVEYFGEVDEDVIIIYFGDHVSNAGPKDDRMLEKTMWSSDEQKYNYETHLVPFLVWSNYQNISDDMGTMEIVHLLPTVFDKYNIEKDLFWEFLLELKEYYSGIDESLILTQDSKYDDIYNMTEEQKKYYEYYEFLQYDYIWGKRYGNYLWKK